LNCEDRTFRFINAGHNPPLLFKYDGTIVPLTAGVMILGITDQDLPYFSDEVALAQNDIILFYTDGVTEAMDKNNKEFTEDRMIDIINDFKMQNPGKCDENRCFIKDMLNHIIALVQKHSSGVHQSDDITLSAIRCFS